MCSFICLFFFCLEDNFKHAADKKKKVKFLNVKAKENKFI